MKKSLIVYFIIIMSVSTLVLFYIAHGNYNDDKTLRYKAITHELQVEARTLIEQKKESTLMIAIAMSKDSFVKQSLIKNDPSLLSLSQISKDYSKSTTFKNVWFHMVRYDGVSFFKSWTPKRGENILNIRKDVKKLLKEPKILSVMSVGKYDMTIKAIVPIYENKRFLGLFEVVTKVNSIAKNLQRDSVNAVILADKSYEKQLTIPFSKKFVNGYYVANVNAKDELLFILKKQNIEKLVSKSFSLVDGYLISIYTQKNINSENMGYFLLFKKLEDINISDLKEKHINFILIWFTFAGILLTILFMILHTSYAGLLERKVKEKTQELNDMNETLKQKVEEETKKNIEQEKTLLQQNKIIEMNDLLNNIAHHWRQPLSMISTSASALKLNIEFGNDTQEDTIQRMDSIIDSADQLSHTIDYFGSALKDEDRFTKFSIKDFSIKINRLIEGLLNEYKISFDIEHEDNKLQITTYETKLINVILSLITNSKDALVQRKIKDKNIVLSTYKDEEHFYIDIIDNAGGVDKEIIDRVFEPYFTTSHKSLNKGLSLYLSYEIVKDNLNGKLSVQNMGPGAKFTIKLPL